MHHILFVGDSVVLNQRVYAGEILPRNQQPDGYGVDVNVDAGETVKVQRHAANGLIEVLWSNNDQTLIDVEFEIGTNEFDHDHEICDDVFDEFNGDPQVITWEDQ